MLNRISTCTLSILVGVAIFATPAVQAQTTWYVDDDAPNDPGPGDPAISDPLEDGSAEHPFDGIQEGIDAAVHGDTVLVLDGTYTEVGNRDLDFGGKAITVRSEDGPDGCIINCEGDPNDPHRGFNFHSSETPDAVLDGFTITGGYVTGSEGGAIYCHNGSSPTISNCVISGNTADGQWGGGISCRDTSNSIIVGCTITGNVGASGGGMQSTDSSPTIANCAFTGNMVGSSGGGISCGGGSPTITNCIILDNTADSGGGIRSSSGTPTITNCLIARNTAESLSGGGMYSSGDPTITNCTVTGNAADDYGDGIFCHNSNLKIRNCILWNTSAGEPEIAVWYGSQLTISYCDVQAGQAGIYVSFGGSLNWGPGNIDGDPLFTDPNNADYHPTAGSPCIDAGYNCALYLDPADLDEDGETEEFMPYDLGFNERFEEDPNTADTGLGFAPIVDLGAYEFQTGHGPCDGDLNGDRQVDLTDLATLLAVYGIGDGGDLNCDGITELTDLSVLLAVYGTMCE